MHYVGYLYTVDLIDARKMEHIAAQLGLCTC